MHGPNDTIIPIDANNAGSFVTSQVNIVVITHGWYELTLWPEEMAAAISNKTDAGKWIVAWLDWRTGAKQFNPVNAAKLARSTIGPKIAEDILQLSKNFEHIHLIGHSAGCWAVNQAAEQLADNTNATIHLTLLDAFVPFGWDSDELGSMAGKKDSKYWIEHYFTSDPTPTASQLKNAHNVDLTKVTPGRNQHRFPFHWYHATITGKFNPQRRYKNKELFYTAGDIEYGFSRSLENSIGNWLASQKLKSGNKPVKITSP